MNRSLEMSANGTRGGSVTEFRTYSMFGLLEVLWDRGGWQLPIFLAVFIFSAAGNVGIIADLAQKRCDRKITNFLFFNLAAADLLATIFCLPFVMLEKILLDFIFQEWVCKAFQIIKGTSTASSIWTLVVLSVERYYVICHPIRSRQWQTVSHARRVIITVWLVGISISVPMAIFYEVLPTQEGGHKCASDWQFERIYSTVIDFGMFVVPLMILAITYYFIAKTLNMRESRVKIAEPVLSTAGVQETSLTENIEHPEEGFLKKCKTKTVRLFKESRQTADPENAGRSGVTSTIELRQTNLEQSLLKKQRVMRAITMVCLQFMVCWTPVYVTGCIARFRPQALEGDTGHATTSVSEVLRYASGLWNPVTYCIMNRCCRNWFGIVIPRIA